MSALVNNPLQHPDAFKKKAKLGKGEHFKRENKWRYLKQCERTYHDGNRCSRHCMKHARFCRRHLTGTLKLKYNAWRAAGFVGRMEDFKPILDTRPRDQKRLRFYKDKLGATLENFVAECLDNPESEQLSLLEELHVLRAFAGDALEQHAKAQNIVMTVANKQFATPEQREQAIKLSQAYVQSAQEVCRAALEQVRVMAKTAADNFGAAKDHFSVHHLHDVVQQIKRFASVAFEHDTAALDRFNALLLAQLKLPKLGAEGTNITPDVDVVEMDASIPSEPPAE
jgi:hypothetical protein